MFLLDAIALDGNVTAITPDGRTTCCAAATATVGATQHCRECFAEVVAGVDEHTNIPTTMWKNR
jgi:hypothetical protein